MVPETTNPYGPQIQAEENQAEGTSGHQVGGPDTSGPSTESDHQPATKTGRLWSPQPKNPKIAKSKSKQAKTKTPVNTKPVGPANPGITTWSDDAITMAYHRHKLDTLLASDPVATALEIRPLGQLGGPVSPLPPLRTVTEAVTALVTLLHESNMVAGRFDPNSLFDLGFDSITSTLNKLHKRLAILVGTTPRNDNVPPATSKTTPSRDSQMTLQDIEVRPPPVLPLGNQGAIPRHPPPMLPPENQGVTPRHPPPMLPPGIQAADDLSSHGSSTPDPVNRMPLGPAGAAMLQARARGVRNVHDAYEMATRVQPNIQISDRLNYPRPWARRT